MKKKKIAALLLFCCCLYACTKSIEGNYPIETTVTVVDMKGHPLSGRTVKAIGASHNTNIKDTKTTDANGRAVLQYQLFLSTSNSPETAVIVVNDDTLLKGINSCQYTVVGHNDKSACTIQMDSIAPFKVRVQKTDTSLIDLEFTGGWIETRNPYHLSHQFASWLPKNIRTVDTTFTLLTWQKTPFTLWTTVVNSNNVLTNKIKSYNVNPQDFRDSVLLIRP